MPRTRRLDRPPVRQPTTTSDGLFSDRDVRRVLDEAELQGQGRRELEVGAQVEDVLVALHAGVRLEHRRDVLRVEAAVVVVERRGR